MKQNYVPISETLTMQDIHKDKLKVLFVLPNLQVGGAERVMVTLMNGLCRARFGPEFLTISNEGPLRAQIAPDTPFHSLKGCRVSRAVPGLYRKLKVIKPDIVVSTMAHMNFAMLLLQPFFPQTSFIVREAALPSMIFQSRRSVAWAIKAAYRMLYPKADLVISPSKPVMQEFSNLKLPIKNHILLYNPVDTSRIRSAAQMNDHLIKFPDNTVRFIAAGQFYWPKGFDRLIENLSNLQTVDWHVTILGEGRDRAKLEGLIKDKNLGDRVSLPGFLPNPWSLYARADCFLLPSRSEGMPNVALESLACGTPVIAMREAGGITDIAALAAPGSVTITSDMSAFILAMSSVKPQKKTAIFPTLLPAEFNLENIISNFSNMLEKAMEDHKRHL